MAKQCTELGAEEIILIVIRVTARTRNTSACPIEVLMLCNSFCSFWCERIFYALRGRCYPRPVLSFAGKKTPADSLPNAPQPLSAARAAIL